MNATRIPKLVYELHSSRKRTCGSTKRKMEKPVPMKTEQVRKLLFKLMLLLLMMIIIIMIIMMTMMINDDDDDEEEKEICGLIRI
jgi:small-conductance mechanosensitive channel